MRSFVGAIQGNDSTLKRTEDVMKGKFRVKVIISLEDKPMKYIRFTTWKLPH